VRTYHSTLPPPAGTPAYAAYVARGATLNARQNQLEAKRYELVQKAAELGLPEPTVTPPPETGGYGAQESAPSNVISNQPSRPRGLSN